MPKENKTNLSQIRDTARSLLTPKKPGGPVKVVFFTYSYLFWDYFASVIRELQKREAFAPKVLIIPQVGLQKELQEDVRHPEALAQSFPLVEEAKYNIANERPDIVFHNTPYASSIPLKYRPEELLRHGSSSLLIPYCTEFMGGESFYELYYGSCQHFSKIFAASAMSSQSYMQLAGFAAQDAPVTGSPEYDAVLSAPAKELEHARLLKNLAGGRKIILWTPHYSIDGGTNWSTWTTLGRDIVRILSALGDEFFVICRPHQLLKPLLRAWQPGNVPANFAEHLARTMHRAGNFYLDSFPRGIQSVFAADAVISDVSSMLTKGMALGKPVLFTVNPQGEGVGRAGEIMDKYLYSATDAAGVEAFISLLRTGGELPPVPQDVRESFCGPVDGKAAARIASHLEQVFFGREG